MAGRTDVQLFTAERAASDRVLHDSSKDWWPAASVTFGPQFLAPSGIFQPSRSWSLSFQLSQPLYDAGSTTNIEVIDAQRSVRDLETIVAQGEDAVRQARLELLVALGRFP